MDGERFDELTRALSAGASRRRVLRGLAGGAAGALAGALGLRRAGAVPVACSDYGRVCTYTGCCSGGAECRCYQNGHCRCLCPAGSALVDGVCLCGATGEAACPPGECCAGDQVCGLVGLGQQGCCLPVGAAIPGGCIPLGGSFEACCGFVTVGGFFTQGCSTITGLCIDPTD